MTNLTQNEITALKSCLNYDDREGQLSDNFSNGGPDEFKKALGWNDQQVGGLITSLQEKGLGDIDDRSGELAWGEKLPHIFWLSDKGVNAIFDIIEAE
jgi:hypothetical protein